MNVWLLGFGGVGVVGSLAMASRVRRRRPMAARILIALAAASCVPLLIAYLINAPDQTKIDEKIENGIKLYEGTFRGSLFSGFLGLGGFLLSLKTFIVVKMKEGLYDHKLYKQRILERAAHANVGREWKPIPVFTELNRLRRILFIAIVSALVTATSQITVGIGGSIYTVAICMAAAAFALTMLVQCLILINANLRDWFRLLEDDAAAQQEDSRNPGPAAPPSATAKS